ncbi:FAD-dependent oxidoreductase [Nioella nitratireducens]|uniref:FAD-dependent oxidoreductase n=1 Tax=Nioella nitratireducens TaxID=1287720 RepID=UPI0008FD8056|nr:FAD-dependent oxidoreductase [Nioella nitratireducens]
MSRSVAIIGAGPSGCFVAQALLKADPDLQVDLIDRLPVPYGLVRYGVAADHQGTKGVVRQFARLFERQGARFVGNVEIDAALLVEVQNAYDAVVLAGGLSQDRRLGIPGEDLSGVHGAGAVTRALYDHPDADALPQLGRRVVLVGNGNVAIDLLRLLAKSPEELDGSDLGAVASEWLANSPVENITIVGRSPAEQAKFDAVMIKELGKLSGVSITVPDLPDTDSPDGAKKIDALRGLAGLSGGPKSIAFRFGMTPVAIEGEGTRVTGMRFSDGAGAQTLLPCDTVLTAVGFGAGPEALDRDRRVAEALDDGAGCLAPGLYAAGWFKRGPRGTIPDNRADAQAVAARILSDFERQPEAGKPGHAMWQGRGGIVNYADWQRIDRAELAGAADGRCRHKISTRAEMLAIVAKTEETT